ncbi:MAG: YlxM family DNA-binding protein [Suilimivivens sp.]|uniref:YlxM family DNA-binding protein n=1 Tax=Suilimivivens sp. TaxID=2981669 RepID=UPI00307B984F
MERIVEQGLLYDFYGELLTEHQKKIYEDVVYNDLSLSEIAQENGISRQGVHDMVRRCNHMLTEYENKLHLVERFLKIRSGVDEMKHLSENTELTKKEILGRVNSLCCEILKEL